MNNQLTNRQLIKKLFPAAKRAREEFEAGRVDLDNRDYYGHPCKWIVVGDVDVFYTNYGSPDDPYVVVEAYVDLDGKYDQAVVSYSFRKGKYCFRKELRGCLGRGYYSVLDDSGKVVKTEVVD